MLAKYWSIPYFLYFKYLLNTQIKINGLVSIYLLSNTNP